MNKWLSHFPGYGSSKRGLHSHPAAHPQGFLSDWESKWRDELLAMNIRWVKMMDPGDAAALPLAERLLEVGIMPVVRFYEKERYPDTISSRELEAVKKYVSIGVHYFESQNEPDLALEWEDKHRPDNWLDIVVDNFIWEASEVRNLGGFLLFPAFGPGGRENPFELIIDRGAGDLLDGNCCLAIHNYCLARPLEYPNDGINAEPLNVSKDGPWFGKWSPTHITEEEWDNTASDMKPDPESGDKRGPMWAWEMWYEKVNEYRDELSNPGQTIMEDSTCFRAFEYFDSLVRGACGHSIPIFTTEGGYNIGQRAGTTHGDDPRYPKPSPQMAAELQMKAYNWLEREGPDYYFAFMPWIIAVGLMGSWQPGFEEQVMWYSRQFEANFYNCENGELPLVQMMKDNRGEIVSNKRRMGLWLVNDGAPPDVTQMYSWKPEAVCCFRKDLGPNKVFEYVADHHEVEVIVRIQHPRNWMENLEVSAGNHASEILSKWPEIAILDPYVYWINEANLWYESGGENQNSQDYYKSIDFYQKYAWWVNEVARKVQAGAPEMKQVCPPLAYGHREDGAPDNDGNLTEDYAGYDYLVETGVITDCFGGIICGHYYWGDHTGMMSDRLYHPEISSWHAFRWRRLLKMFKTKHNLDLKLIIDECGGFDTSHFQFTDQLIYYADECLRDSRVLAVTPFLYFDTTSSPGNMPNSWIPGITDLQGHLDRLAAHPGVSVDDEIDPPADGFDFQYYNRKFLANPSNDAQDYGVLISGEGTHWKAIGVHHLSPEENQTGHNVYLEALDEDGQRVSDVEVVWTWEGNAETYKVSLDKPANEPAGNIVMHWDQRVALWVSTGFSDEVVNLHIMHPDEAPGNTRGHHSFYVVFQRVDDEPDTPDTEPPEPPEQSVTVSIERGEGLPLIVGDWFEAGVMARLSLEGAGIDRSTLTGSKTEFGDGGMEFYAIGEGDHLLEIDGNEFIIPMSGEFTKLTFHKTEIPTEQMVRLVSNPMTRTQAEDVLNSLGDDADWFDFEEYDDS
jgi:hypothetical protein